MQNVNNIYDWKESFSISCIQPLCVVTEAMETILTRTVMVHVQEQPGCQYGLPFTYLGNQTLMNYAMRCFITIITIKMD